MHVKLFDLNVMPVTLSTSAIIRKHLFSRVKDYSPWNFTYAVSGTEMPVFADPAFHKNSIMNTNLIM